MEGVKDGAGKENPKESRWAVYMYLLPKRHTNFAYHKHEPIK